MSMNHSESGNGFNFTSLFGTSQHTIAIGLDGYWGPVTSTLDWCEENYQVTGMVAEFWNTMSNLWFIALPLFGLLSCVKSGAEPRFYASFFALMLVGTGSFLFHGTLTYAMQLLDELPMTLATCIWLYTHIQMFSSKSSPKTIMLMTAVFTAVTASYLFLQTPILFQLAFIGLTLIQVGTALNNIRLISRTHKSESRSLYILISVSVGAILAAFTLWNLDQVQCGEIQSHRNAIGYPFRVGLELHAWWHVLSGYSAFVGVVGAQYCRMLALGRTDVELTVWGGILPVVVPKQSKAVQHEGKSKRA